MTLLFIPGPSDSEPAHWQSCWQRRHADSLRVEQTDWSSPDLDTWLAVVAEHVRRHPGVILVGHSLGAILIAHLSARHPELDVGGALIVAPADPELRRNGTRVPGLRSFRPLPLEPLGFPALLVGSRTDPYMAQDRARIIANLWEAAFVDAGNAGHINVASGYGPWPEGLPLLDRLYAARDARHPTVPRADTRQRPLRHPFNMPALQTITA
jgi:predicted alpha/beta hydrolase family esterase